MSPEKATVKGALKSASGAVQTVVSSAAVVRNTSDIAAAFRDTGVRYAGVIPTDAGPTDAGFAGYTRSC